MKQSISIFPNEFPQSWASDWGEDDYGIFMGFTYKGVRQDFRWIEFGTFLMGSPEDEPERESNGADETQKEVTFSQGFWIADVPVTQALWEAVMGNNPSNFPNPDCPVENINWDDAQAFISRMNEMKPELKLCLPLEAQWEYACRTGSTSPFFFGDQITSEIANFDGHTPYNNGEKSEFRQHTVDVKSFPSNAWGLYGMHGNVWEWCQDGYDLNIPEEDPSIVRRVLRGGSWLSNGSDCRSAHRSRIIQTHRHSTYGFRLALFAEDLSVEENWFSDEQDEDESWFWEKEARRVVEMALERAEWNEEARTITLTDPDDEHYWKVIHNREELETFLSNIAGTALYANAPRDDGEFVLIDNDEFDIVSGVLEEYEQRLDEFFWGEDESP
jgi:hypothetical protein